MGQHPGLGPRLVDAGNAISSVSLNSGRLFWLNGLQGNYGGATSWFDLRKLYHGTLNGSPTWRPSPYGFCPLLNGSSQYVSQAADAVIGNTDGTVAAWVIFGGTMGMDSRIFSCSSGGFQNFIDIALDGTNWLVRSFTSSAERIYATVARGSTFASGWWRIVFRGGTGGNALFVNGVQQSLTYSTGSSSTTTWFGSFGGGPSGIYWGAQHWSGPTNYWNGSIADASVWNRALTDAEIWKDFTEGVHGYPTLLRRFVPSVWTFGTGGAVPQPTWFDHMTSDPAPQRPEIMLPYY